LGAIGLACTLVAQPTASLAQEAKGEAPTITAAEALSNAEELWSGAIDIKAEDPCATTDDPDVIIVCRRWESGERYMFERPPDRPVGADVRSSGSGSPRPPDFNESCLHNRGRENCMMGGWVPEPAYMVDFDALPETPAGSEAARLYGGPTTDDEQEQEEPVEVPDLDAETLRGIDDDIYGP
jgi:hypothetical protein